MGCRPIVVELRGRLGNQLFQFAVGCGLARAHGADLFFDDARLHPGDLLLPEVVGEHFRRADERLLLRLGHRDPRRRRAAARYARSWGAQARARLTRHTLHVRELSPHRFDPFVVAAEPPYFLQGFLQSERYFLDVAGEVAAGIRLPDPPALGPGPVVAVSYRRGDYVGSPYLLPMTYYDAALERVCAEVQPGTIVVFSDDHEFAALVAPRLERFAPTRVGVARHPAHVLAEMAACDHFVISNSSFAWWGAWLAERRPGRHLVAAPRGWLTRGKPEDTVPDRWMQLDWA